MAVAIYGVTRHGLLGDILSPGEAHCRPFRFGGLGDYVTWEPCSRPCFTPSLTCEAVPQPIAVVQSREVGLQARQALFPTPLPAALLLFADEHPDVAGKVRHRRRGHSGLPCQRENQSHNSLQAQVLRTAEGCPRVSTEASKCHLQQTALSLACAQGG